jgi:uncharacterized membrane protein
LKSLTQEVDIENLLWVLVLIVPVVFVILIWVPGIGFMGGMMGMMGTSWVALVIFPVAFGVLIVLGIYFFITGITTGDSRIRGMEQTPLEILKTRYAAGEITQHQYQTMKEDLEV